MKHYVFEKNRWEQKKWLKKTTGTTRLFETCVRSKNWLTIWDPRRPEDNNSADRCRIGYEKNLMFEEKMRWKLRLRQPTRGKIQGNLLNSCIILLGWEIVEGGTECFQVVIVIEYDDATSNIIAYVRKTVL